MANLFGTDGSQVNVLPFLIVATSIWPKLSSDQEPGSKLTVVTEDSSPQSCQDVAFVTTALSECDAAVDPLAPRPQPVKVVGVTPV